MCFPIVPYNVTRYMYYLINYCKIFKNEFHLLITNFLYQLGIYKKYLCLNIAVVRFKKKTAIRL